MSFHPISTTANGAQTWNEAGAGRYVLSTTLFGSPLEYFKLSGGKLGKDGRIAASLGYTKEKDITVGSTTERQRLQMSLPILVYPSGFTTSEVDMGLQLLSEVATTAFIDRLLKGEQ